MNQEMKNVIKTLWFVLIVGLGIAIAGCSRKEPNEAQDIESIRADLREQVAAGELTKEEAIVKTPTYYVFKMYKVHHDATLLPLDLMCEDYTYNDKSIPALTASASLDDKGLYHLTLSNFNPDTNINVTCEIRGLKNLSFKRGEIITANKINSFNDFGKAEEVTLKDFTGVKVSGNTITVNMPAKSIVMVEF